MLKTRNSSNFVCSQCGYSSVQWYGKCPSCGTWNSFQEFRVGKSKTQNAKRKTEEVKPVRLSEVKMVSSERISSGIEEFDRVLGNGFVRGSIVLLAGEPGVGKSTLLLGLIKGMESAGKRNIFYVCGEESPEQVKLRAERVGITGENLLLLPETNVETIIEEVRSETEDKNTNPELLIIDSVQTLWSEDFEGEAGSVSQVKGCAQKLLEVAKNSGIPIVLVGHVTKEGVIAGPMILSHMVDVVLFLEGERFTELRLLRGFKNRFGPTDEVGVFKMTEKGMEEVINPSELFLGRDKESKAAGALVVCAMEGTRPVLLEIQALVTQSALTIPRRVVSGVDYNRVMLLIAVLQKILRLPLYNQDIYVKIGGGFKVLEPAADLDIALAIISSFKNLPVPPKTCVFGEVGLLSEIKRVGNEEKRAKEAKKLGFTKILSSLSVKNLQEAITLIQN